MAGEHAETIEESGLVVVDLVEGARQHGVEPGAAKMASLGCVADKPSAGLVIWTRIMAAAG